MIEDLLLLSRMDAGRLKIAFAPVDLPVARGWLDDLSALPDALGLEVETDCGPGCHIAGEKRYAALILQNLLENARKYNRAGGPIRIAARKEGRSCSRSATPDGRSRQKPGSAFSNDSTAGPWARTFPATASG